MEERRIPRTKLRLSPARQHHVHLSDVCAIDTPHQREPAAAAHHTVRTRGDHYRGGGCHRTSYKLHDGKRSSRGAAARTPVSNNFGEPYQLKTRLGCEPIFGKSDKVLTEHLNRITQLTVCTRLHRPFEAMSNFAPAPRGYEAFFLYVDLSAKR